jgi:hypothetical protein
MQNVEELHLENIAVTGILSLLSVHGGKLKLSKLRIVNCAAQTLGISEDLDHPTWADLWSMVQSSVTPGAEIEILLPKRLLLPDERFHSHHGDYIVTESDDEYEDIQQLRRKMQEDEDFHGWPYVWVCSGSATSIPEAEVNQERLEIGEDNLQFGLLVDKVQRGGGKCIVKHHICGVGPGSCFHCVYLEKEAKT